MNPNPGHPVNDWGECDSYEQYLGSVNRVSEWLRKNAHTGAVKKNIENPDEMSINNDTDENLDWFRLLDSCR